MEILLKIFIQEQNLTQNNVKRGILMTEEKILHQFIDAIVGMDIEAAKKVSEDALKQNIQPFKLIQEGIVQAVNVIGEKFEAEEYFLAELIMGGEIIKEVMKILEPHIKDTGKIKALGKIVIGTGKGDLHDIGKNIVNIFLRAEGFEVIDLGVDVSAEKFIEAVRTEKPKILAISALVSMTMPEVNNVLKALKEANLRNQVKIIVGGAPITQEFVSNIGADAYAKNAIDGIKICKRWAE